MKEPATRYGNRILVMGRGAKGALMRLGETGGLVERPAFDAGGATNTVGAGDALFATFLHGMAGGRGPVRRWSGRSCLRR